MFQVAINLDHNQCRHCGMANGKKSENWKQ